MEVERENENQQLTETVFCSMQNQLLPSEMIIIKFTAGWCGPCQSIKPICDKYINMLPKSIKFIEIDIDESIELYMKLKKYKMVNGIPAILAYIGPQKENWYIPDDSCLGGNKDNVEKFFERCINYTV